MRLFPILFLAVTANALGNAFLSDGMKKAKPAIDQLIESERYISVVVTVLTTPSFALGLALLLTFFLLFLTLLSKADLSYVLPVTSINYVLTVVLAVVMLREHVTVTRWLAVLMISGGVLLVTRGESRTTAATEIEPC